MRPLPLKLAPGSDLRLSLEDLARREGIDGFVLGVVGNLTRAAFQCPGQSEPTVLEGDLEVITLNGTLSPDSVHLHLSLSDGACQVWGGHLEPGTIVQKGADVLIGVLEQNKPAAYDNRNGTAPRDCCAARMSLVQQGAAPTSDLGSSPHGDHGE
jgi:predicted DNA-binding protein with PD1-like motif